MSFYQILNKGDMKTVLDTMNRPEKDLVSILNNVYSKEVDVPGLGIVRNLSVPQYLIYSILIKNFEKLSKRDQKDLFFSVVKKSSLNTLQHEDSKKNTLLHYCSILSDVDILKIVLENQLEFKVNLDGKYAYDLCPDQKIKNYMLEHADDSRKEFRISNNKSEEIQPKKLSIDFYDLKEGEEGGEVNAFNQVESQSIVTTVPFKQALNRNLESRDLRKYNLENNSVVGSATDEYKVYHFEPRSMHTKKVYENPIEEVKIRLYPGNLYFIFDQSNLLSKTEGGGDILFFLINSGNSALKVVDYNTNFKGGDMKKMASLPISDTKKNILVEVFLEKKRKNMFKKYSFNKTKKIGSFSIKVEKNTIEECHNKIMKYEYPIFPQSSIFGNLLSKMFSKKKNCNMKAVLYMIYLSEEEMRYVDTPEPSSVETLLQWLRIRKISIYLWYRGFSGVKGEYGTTATYLWKRRLVKWQGTQLMVYNESNGIMLGSFDMTLLESFSVSKEDLLPVSNYIKLCFKDGNLEMNFEDSESYQKFVSILTYFLEF